MAETLRIGELAGEAGVNVETIRYYERRRLLAEPGRRPSGYRSYGREVVGRVRFIKRAQQLGFTLTEIGELLRLRDDQTARCEDVRSAAIAKLQDIEEKIRSLRAMKRALGVLVKSCTKMAAIRECPILEALDDSKPKERKR